MEQYINKAALVAEIERRKYQFVSQAESFRKIGKEDKESYFAALASNMNSLSCFIDTLEVKEVDISSISENLAEAYEYLGYTHTSNLAHNKPMIVASLRRAIKKLYNAGLFQLTHDVKYRMESLGLKTQKGE